MEPVVGTGAIETPDDLGRGDRAVARRWKLELKIAERREKSWIKSANEIYDLYTPDSPENNSFNILWSNTETLRQAVYNSLPDPQCRRRYSDKDPVGGKVSELMTRALEYSIDCGEFDHVCKQAVLGMLLAGRAVIWEQYIPKIGEAMDDLGDSYEQLEWEQVESEQVSYKDFRILGAAKCWDEVPAIARRYYLSRDDLIEKFGEEVGNKIKMDDVDLDEKDQDAEVEGLFKTAEVWAVWDKEKRQVVFITESLDVPCKVEDDPFGLEGFFPTPRPMYAIENDTTLIPACLYTQYEQQAKELNRISNRINKLVDALRVRGVYDASLTELGQLMKQQDNNFIPAQNARMLIERGGLEKAIWMMPIDMAAMVLKELYAQRDATKQVIYEISGISDIMRSASDPSETLGAQQLKTIWGTQRLQKMQREVQRYIRDLIRIKAEIICKKFQPETLLGMTLMQIPTQEQVMQQMMLQYQNAALAARQAGSPPPPPPALPPNLVTLEQVMQVLRSDMDRSYRIDIETDSTILANQQQDMKDLREIIGGMVEIINGFAPAVQAQAIPIDAVKELIGVVIRRAKLGSAVEEAFEGVTQPAPQADPEAQKAQAQMQQQQQQMQAQQQIEQMKTQNQMAIEQAQMQADIQTENAKAQANIASEQARSQADAQIEMLRHQLETQKISHQAQLEAMKQQLDLHKHNTQLQANWDKDSLNAATKIAIAQMQQNNKKDEMGED